MYSNKSPSVVVVDDDEDDRYLLRLAFERLLPAQSVVYLSDCEQALSHLKQGQTLPRLLLTDLNMPILDGAELITRIRQTTGLRLLPAVVLTTTLAPREHQRCYEVGANACLVKPGSHDELARLLSSVVHIWLPGLYRQPLLYDPTDWC